MRLNINLIFYFSFFLQLFTKGTGFSCQCYEASEFNVIEISGVLENAPLNSLVKSLTFDGGSDIDVKAVNSNPYVFFNEDTYVFSVAKNFEVTKHSPLIIDDIILQCTILQNDQKIIYKVIIGVEDTNNHPPVFANQPYVFNISELTPPGVALTPDITATDDDPRDAGSLTYYIVNDNPYSDYFNITIPSNGRLVLQRPLNHQEIPQISLKIQVKDNTYNKSVLGQYQPQHIASTTAIINVISIFADIPSFIKQSYTLNIEEEDNEDIVVDPSWSLHVKDGYTFSFVQDPNMEDWRHFTIDENTGRIKVANKLTLSQYLLQIQVRKSSKSFFGTCLLVLRRTPKMRFANTNFNLTIHNSTPPNSHLILLELNNSLIQCGTSSYDLLKDESDENASFFEITKAGWVSLRKKIDSSLSKSFKLKIFLYSNSIRIDTAYLHVDILQEKLSKTRFSKDIYEFDYFNNTHIGKLDVISQLPEHLISFNLITKNKGLTIDNNGVISCQGGDCWSFPQSSLATLATIHTNQTLQDSTLILLTPTNYLRSANLNSSSVDYKAAFIVAMLIACLLFIAILSFVIFACLLYKKRSEQFDDQFNNISTTFSEESSDAFAHNRKPSKLDKLQGVLVGRASDIADSKGNQVTKEENMGNTNKQSITTLPSSLNSVNKQKNIAKDPMEAQMSDSSILTRTDINTSQDTINASVVTLTRPAVGTNGITVYF